MTVITIINIILHARVTDDVSMTEAHSSPMLTSRNGSKSATPSPVAPGSRRGTGSVSSQDWSNINADDDIDRLVGMHQTRSSLSSLGVSYYIKGLTNYLISVSTFLQQKIIIGTFFKFSKPILFTSVCTDLSVVS